MDIQTLKETFEQTFHRHDGQLYFAPGRINLIGEHTDYNGGRVFPASISNGTYAIIALRDDQEAHCYSLNFEDEGIITWDIHHLENKEKDGWTNYLKGMIKYIREAGYTIDRGFDVLIWGNIPNGAGLSSSASLELLIGIALDDLFQLNIGRVSLIKMGKQTENHFIGVNSGIMDQFAIGMGKKDYAIYLDTNTLDYELVPADFKDHVILIINTNKRRELVKSNYNERRQQCEEALHRLQTELDIQSLGELDEASFEEHRHLINDEVLERRAKHAVYENRRTQKAKEALTRGDLPAFGQLLNESHQSLRDDYEVTGEELDCLAETCWQQEGVLGARMTGAGMGGCAIALVHNDYVTAVKDAVEAAYIEAIGYAPSFYIAEIGDGAKKL